MRIKYNRVSTLNQTGNRFTADNDKYDMVMLDKVSGTVNFKERPKAKELVKLVEDGKVRELVVEELSRLGRNTGDVINNLEWFDEKEVNVVVRNLGIQSRPNGKRNPIWKLIGATMSSLYELELENIKERTMVGRAVFVQNGGKLGRPEGTLESKKKFIEKPKNQEILKYLKRGLRYSEIEKLLGCSPKTIKKVRDFADVD
ncbi:recombinase family protein [Mangrovibacterium lignilyticum]|uniref:recombinase family protein n=1 Tax=Mangrovibacterium lignilyticum TaxID=2668052 RepID=UPI0013D54232|nr:recombinase family protein [Mangrovibacterium lignilyticum]